MQKYHRFPFAQGHVVYLGATVVDVVVRHLIPDVGGIGSA
jgi:hypothetical protein